MLFYTTIDILQQGHISVQHIDTQLAIAWNNFYALPPSKVPKKYGTLTSAINKVFKAYGGSKEFKRNKAALKLVSHSVKLT